jgi:hypothetical protein
MGPPESLRFVVSFSIRGTQNPSFPGPSSDAGRGDQQRGSRERSFENGVFPDDTRLGILPDLSLRFPRPLRLNLFLRRKEWKKS